jgi:hypothetical protein
MKLLSALYMGGFRVARQRYPVLHMQKAMQILHRGYAITGYPNRLKTVITGVTPKRQEQE